MTPSPARAGPLLKGVGCAALAALVADAVVRVHGPAGVSTFGRPPELVTVWILAGLAALVLALRASDRLEFARVLTLALTAAGLFGQQGVAAQPSLHLVLAGVTLLAARPFLRWTPAGAAACGALLLAVPAAVTARFPQGVVLWLPSLLPYVALAVLLPSLFDRDGARRVALVVCAGCAVLAAAALATYPALADGLALPLGPVLSTRLRPLGMHPNLAVPQLVTALLLAIMLLGEGTRGRRLVAAGSALVLAAALVAVQSRTGALTAVVGAGLLVVGRLGGRIARFAWPAALLATVAALIVPVTGLSDGTITRPNRSMVSKAASFRSAQWELGRDTWFAAPITGNGPRSLFMQGVSARSGRYDGMPKDDHPHNVVLLVGESLGWPGLAGLAWLLVAGLRRRPGGDRLTDAATAATVVVWVANGIDLGGTALTVYPSLAFLYLGLGDAAARAEPEGVTAAGRPGPLGSAAIVAVSLAGIALGLVTFWGEHLVDSVETELARDADTRDPAARDALLDDLLAADRVAPFDPRIPAARARLAAEDRDLAGQIAALEEALARFPDSASLNRALALALARRDLSDPRVEALLDEALRLDPFGPEAWATHTDRALVHARSGDADAALDELLTAVLLDPAALRRPGIVYTSSNGLLRLSPDGSAGVDIPLSDLLTELGRRRDELAQLDPMVRLRLAMREIDVLTALGEHERVDELAAQVFTDPRYLGKHLARSALRRGDVDEAVARYAENAPYVDFEILVENLDALVRQEELDRDAAHALIERIEQLLPDPLFQLGSLERYLEARRRLAERTLDSEEAARFADALAYARR